MKIKHIRTRLPIPSLSDRKSGDTVKSRALASAEVVPEAKSIESSATKVERLSPSIEGHVPATHNTFNTFNVAGLTIGDGVVINIVLPESLSSALAKGTTKIDTQAQPAIVLDNKPEPKPVATVRSMPVARLVRPEKRIVTTETLDWPCVNTHYLPSGKDFLPVIICPEATAWNVAAHKLARWLAEKEGYECYVVSSTDMPTLDRFITDLNQEVVVIGVARDAMINRRIVQQNKLVMGLASIKENCRQVVLSKQDGRPTLGKKMVYKFTKGALIRALLWRTKPLVGNEKLFEIVAKKIHNWIEEDVNPYTSQANPISID